MSKRDTCPPTFIAAILTIAKTWTQPVGHSGKVVSADEGSSPLGTKISPTESWVKMADGFGEVSGQNFEKPPALPPLPPLGFPARWILVCRTCCLPAGGLSSWYRHWLPMDHSSVLPSHLLLGTGYHDKIRESPGH